MQTHIYCVRMKAPASQIGKWFVCFMADNRPWYITSSLFSSGNPKFFRSLAGDEHYMSYTFQHFSCCASCLEIWNLDKLKVTRREPKRLWLHHQRMFANANKSEKCYWVFLKLFNFQVILFLLTSFSCKFSWLHPSNENRRRRSTDELNDVKISPLCSASFTWCVMRSLSLNSNYDF